MKALFQIMFALCFTGAPVMAQDLITPDSLRYLLTDDTGILFQQQFKTPKGKPFQFKEVNKKVVLIDFWATWCKPCIQSQPKIDSLVTSIGTHKVEVVYLSIDESEESWRKFLNANPWNGTHILANKTTNKPIFDLITSLIPFGNRHMTAVTIPQYYLLSKSGRLLAAPAPESPEMRTMIMSLVNE
jgi:thiol-disulfide isomerase/thioredoxin